MAPSNDPARTRLSAKTAKVISASTKVYGTKLSTSGEQLFVLNLAADTDAQSAKFEAILRKIMGDQCAREDASIMGLLAAGSAADVYFYLRLHKRLYGTRSAFAEQVFGTSARTLSGWIKAYKIFEAIGGLDSPLPTHIHQLTILGKILPHHRRRAWMEAPRAADKTPSGAELLDWAEKNDVLIQPRPKTDPTYIPDVPLINDHAARMFIGDLRDQAAGLKHHNMVQAMEMLVDYIKRGRPKKQSAGTSKSNPKWRPSGQLQLFHKEAVAS